MSCTLSARCICYRLALALIKRERKQIAPPFQRCRILLHRKELSYAWRILMAEHEATSNNKSTVTLSGHTSRHLAPKHSDGASKTALKGNGPLSRLNHPSYREWSFFCVTRWHQFVEKNVLFLTKEAWPDGAISRSLVLGFPTPTKRLMGARSTHLSEASEPQTITMELRQCCDRQQKFYSILVSLPPQV